MMHSGTSLSSQEKMKASVAAANPEKNNICLRASGVLSSNYASCPSGAKEEVRWHGGVWLYLNGHFNWTKRFQSAQWFIISTSVFWNHTKKSFTSLYKTRRGVILSKIRETANKRLHLRHSKTDTERPSEKLKRPQSNHLWGRQPI